MTPNQRIVLNFVATYGRTLYTLVIGLLCGRWTLMALGEVDYGLMGLVGGLTAFVSFFNSLMANAVSRFFAFSVGEAQKQGGEGVEICRKWFNAALSIHTVIPVVMLVVGYPVGVWAVEHFLTIPADRVVDCVWVWRFVCFSTFLGMISVPFNAMYQAKQYIAELTIYTFVTVTLNAGFLYYMVTHPGVWLVKLMLWNCLLGIAPQIIIAVRAIKLFPECRFVPAYLWDVARFKEVFVYAFYRFFGALAIMIKGQGLNILVNKYLGPARNAAVNVAGSVSGQCDNLAGAFLTALSPAITTAYGAGDMKRAHTLSYSACKYSTIMALIFILPLFLEAEKVFRLWLVKPPEGVVPMCLCLMVVLALENLTCGLYMPIFADGRIRGYQSAMLLSGVLALAIAWVLLAYGCGVLAVGMALVFAEVYVVGIRLIFARKICAMSAGYWIFRIALPLTVISLLSLGCGYAFRQLQEPSLVRIMATSIVVNMVFLPLAYLFALDAQEKKYFVGKLLSRFSKRQVEG